MTRPRLGFIGTGWIGRHRMEAILATGLVEAVAIADPSAEMVAEARALAPDALVVNGLDAMLALKPDGVVIATPSALHADQAIRALAAGAAVFCQKRSGVRPTRRSPSSARRGGRIACCRSTSPTDSPQAWLESASWFAPANWAMSMRSIWCSTTLMAPTSRGSMTARNRVAAASWTWASTSSIWRCGASAFRRWRR